MPETIKKRSKKTGLPPGTLVHIGEKKSEKTKVSILDYDEENSQEKVIETVEECLPFKEKPSVTWINVDGLHEVEVLEKLGNYFGLHPLVMEDILNTDQRPKMEDLGEYLYIVLKMIYYDDKRSKIMTEQISLILGANFVISFQEKEGEVFDPVRERIMTAKGLIRKMGTDYLTYALLDLIIDNYFVVLERLGEKIDYLEEELVKNPTPETSHEIHNLRREMVFLRRSVWPLREVISGLERGESSLIKESTMAYFRDVYDHAIQVIDSIETFREMLSGMLDIYLSSISNKMNQVMKVLTVIATIFMPLTFVVGVYGMNFKYMPELEWRWAYPLTWLIMIVIVISMLIYFRRKKWL